MDLEKLDDREFLIGEGYNFKVTLYQIEILRLIRILEAVHSNNLAETFRRLIFIRDFNEKTITSFNRLVPKGEVRRYIMSPISYKLYVDSKRDINSRMVEYYGKI